jgi:hypothetical protein
VVAFRPTSAISQVGQPLDQGAVERDPFADRDNHVGGPQSFDQLLERGRRLPVACDVVPVEQGVTGQPFDGVLIFIGNDDMHWRGTAPFAIVR